jgi:hypothetical protein
VCLRVESKKHQGSVLPSNTFLVFGSELEFSRCMEALRRDEEQASDYKEVRRGWRFGTEEFVARILDRIDGNSGENQTRRKAEESMSGGPRGSWRKHWRGAVGMSDGSKPNARDIRPR